jgi:hypothetical protein
MIKNNNSFDKKLDAAWFTFNKDERASKPSYLLIKILILIVFLSLIFFSFSSNASYCLLETSEGNLRIDSSSVESCSSGLILLSKTEYDAVNAESIVATLLDLFEFSVEDFALFNAICLIGFISGHALGRVSRILGKT